MHKIQQGSSFKWIKVVCNVLGSICRSGLLWRRQQVMSSLRLWISKQIEPCYLFGFVTALVDAMLLVKKGTFMAFPTFRKRKDLTWTSLKSMNIQNPHPPKPVGKPGADIARQDNKRKQLEFLFLCHPAHTQVYLWQENPLLIQWRHTIILETKGAESESLRGGRDSRFHVLCLVPTRMKVLESLYNLVPTNTPASSLPSLQTSTLLDSLGYM